MKKVLIYAGTTEGRMLAEQLAAEHIPCHVCVATAYGQLVMPEMDGVEVTTGRLDIAQMRQLASEMTAENENAFAAVVDSTHPFATEVSGNIRKSLEGLDIPYFRLLRGCSEAKAEESGAKITYFEDNESCAKALQEVEGNILLTTGSKELGIYSGMESLKERLYVRVLPGLESIEICEKQGIHAKHIIAMQGPFSIDLNAAILRQFSISCLVTKESGKSGGYLEKLEAAERTGARAFVIRAPKEEGQTFEEVVDALYEQYGKTRALHAENMVSDQTEIALIGLGMSERTLTQEGAKAVAEADLVFGAKRMIADVPGEKETYPYYLAKDIIPVIRKKEKEGKHAIKAAVLFSGDTGFYSGCTKMQKELKENGFTKVRIYPGICSISYLAAAVGETWQDAKLLSIHGRKEETWPAEILDAVNYHAKTYLLVSTVEDVQKIGKLLQEAEISCEIVCGRDFGGASEIRTIVPAEAKEITKEGLYTCLIRNDSPKKRELSQSISDDAFIRGKVPMTKEEIRHVSLGKLHLTEDAVFYDIGSGTGSIAVAAAQLSPNIQVYAMERKEAALELMQQNIEKFHLKNVAVVAGEAPDSMQQLPAPTHAFVGGSGGNLKQILEVVWQKNPLARVVINAISLETIAEVTAFLQEHREDVESEVIQMQVSRGKQAGAYHLMQAENPVMIFTLRKLA